jgi:hypothetical protein
MDELKKHIETHKQLLDTDEPAINNWQRISQRLLAGEDGVKTVIQDNVDLLDIDTPKEYNWHKIKTELSPVHVLKPKRNIKWIAISAAACIALLVTLIVSRSTLIETEKTPETAIAKTPVADTEDSLPTTEVIKPKPITDKINEYKQKQIAKAVIHQPAKKQKAINALPPEIEQLQQDYNTMISSQIKHVQSLAIYGEEASYFNGFKNDFKQLDIKEKELRQLILKSGLQETTIMELANIYQQKLMVLKRLQQEIDKTKLRTKNALDTVPNFIKI